VDFRDVTVPGMLDLTQSVCDRDVLFGGTSIQGVDLSQATIAGHLRYDGEIANTFRMHNAVVKGSTELRFRNLAHVQAQTTEFRGAVTVEGPAIASLYLPHATIRQGLTLRGRYDAAHGGMTLRDATLLGPLDFRDADIADDLVFPDVTFDSTSTLDLRGARVRRTFVLGDLPVVSREIRLDGARFDNDVRIEAVAGAHRPKVIALERRPMFGRAVTLTNVNLSECLLVGNVLDEIEFWNVEWPRYRGRYLLRDEILERRAERMPPSNLREAYQVLKRKYQEKGDHVRSGDFHYGEMEMRRREYSSLWRRMLWPEAWYWLTSGYGTRPLRAFLALVVIVVLSGSWYLWHDALFFGWNEFRAFRFSLAVATLQRPEIPPGFSDLGLWLYRLEAVLAPIQAALFGLALRMRLKR
jgi:hypothetical protein